MSDKLACRSTVTRLDGQGGVEGRVEDTVERWVAPGVGGQVVSTVRGPVRGVAPTLLRSIGPAFGRNAFLPFPGRNVPAERL